MKTMKTRILLFLALWLIPNLALAMPSDRKTRLVWSHDGDIDLAGFYVYAAPESENPRVYSDVRRFQIPLPANRETLILDIQPDIAKRWCFKITAYDVSGNESGFSNEACGWFGFASPNALTVE